jgi:hypothetical protein
MLTVNQLIGFGAGGRGAPNIQFVGGNTSSKVGATSGNTTISLSSGLTGGIASAAAEGDLVIAAFASGSSTSSRTLAITDGTNNYTTIEKMVDGAPVDAHLRVAYKFASGDTSTTFGPTGSTNDAGAMAVYVFRGVDSTTPMDVTHTTASGSGTTNANPPSIEPVTAGAFIVCVGASGHLSGADTFTSSDLTDFQTDGANDSNDVTLGIGHIDNWTSGAFNASAFGGVPNNSASWVAMSIALRPA